MEEAGRHLEGKIFTLRKLILKKKERKEEGKKEKWVGLQGWNGTIETLGPCGLCFSKVLEAIERLIYY